MGTSCKTTNKNKSHIGKGGVAWGELVVKIVSGESEQDVPGHSVPNDLGRGSGLIDAMSERLSVYTCNADVWSGPWTYPAWHVDAARHYSGMPAPPQISCTRTRFLTGSPRRHAAVASCEATSVSRGERIFPTGPVRSTPKEDMACCPGRVLAPRLPLTPCHLRPMQGGSGH